MSYRETAYGSAARSMAQNAGITLTPDEVNAYITCRNSPEFDSHSDQRLLNTILSADRASQFQNFYSNIFARVKSPREVKYLPGQK